ncbi:MAG TPA: prolyl oligopeptidase family serine peptidase, partial [Candidatus Levybacteria bacterium]|nr:prolyl oligopeptidase family serine peptidase [Candidatus Levybacteria bacterium]
SYQRPVISLTPRPNSRQRIGEVHGEPESNSPFWQQMAPTNYLTDLKGAVQLNHATNDDVVTVQYSRDLNRLLDATSVPHELHEYSSGGHNIDGSAFVEAMGNTVAFYKKYLQ